LAPPMLLQHYGTFAFSLVDDEKCSCGIGGVT